MKTLQDSLRIKASMIALGERIALGSDSEIMIEAADTIEKLTRERDEYQQAADSMAMAHKVERDGLRAELDEQLKLNGKGAEREYVILGKVEMLEREVAALKALSVTNIMIDVTPGCDGMGHEVYAKSVTEVEALLSKLGDTLDEVESLKREVAALKLDSERLDWVVQNKNMRVQGRLNSWYVLNCNGLTFVARDKKTSRDAIDAAMKGVK